MFSSAEPALPNPGSSRLSLAPAADGPQRCPGIQGFWAPQMKRVYGGLLGTREEKWQEARRGVSDTLAELAEFYSADGATGAVRAQS